MSKDLEVIAYLQSQGIPLEQRDERDWGNKAHYILKDDVVIGLQIKKHKITSSLFEEITKLSNLQELYLSSNQIQSTPESLASLTNLQELYLSSNQIQSTPESLASLTNLQVLNLSSNQIQSIPESLASLTNLQRLYLSSNQIQSIPESLASLTNLQRLDLDSNQIQSIPESLASLTNLQELYLSSNQIQSIPESLASLTNLQRLDLDSNQIQSIPESLASLTNLQVLGLSSNQIQSTPESLASLTRLQRLDLNNNKLPKINESLKKPSEIINYLLKHQKLTKKPMNEVKVLVVGDERVGKTSVIRRLTKDEFDDNEISTKGVAISSYDIEGQASEQINSPKSSLISRLKKLFLVSKPSKDVLQNDVDISCTNLEDIKLNIWDFAGQQVTHTPHQYFMTEQSLYMFVLDAQVEDTKNHYTIRYWLDMIKSYAGTEVPILIVVNKIDMNSGYRFDIHKYRESYPNIVSEVTYLSSKEGENFHKLKELIQKEVLELKSVKELFPVDYHTIKRELEALKADYIEDREYYNICEKHNVSEDKEQKILLKVLNAMGTVVSYSEKLNLDRTYVINPEWVTNAVYEIIRSEPLKQSKGVLRREDLSDILCNTTYKPQQYSWIISLMERFEVCFAFDDKKETVLVPAVFENLEPELHLEKYEDGFKLRILYEFLPKSVISKFIVRSKYMIKDSLYWRDGVVLEYEGVQAVVKAESLDNRIDIFLLNNGAQSQEFLNIIRNDLRGIGDNKLKYNERVPLYLPQHKGQFVPYKQLVSMEKKGVQTNYFGAPEPEEYEIRKLLHGYDPQANLAKINKLIHYLKSNPSEENRKLLKDILEITEKEDEKSFGDRLGDNIDKMNAIYDLGKNSVELGEILIKLWA